MQIDQRNAGASVTHSGTSNMYGMDRMVFNSNGTPQFSVQQVSDAPAGFSYSAKLTTTTSGTPASTDFSYFGQYIEGYNAADLAFGTASAATVTLSFWVKSSLTGTFGGGLLNSAVNRSYVFSYTINAANTWEKKSITIAGDTTGTWLTTNGIGIEVLFDTGAGANNKAAAGSWVASAKQGVTSGVNLVANASATWQVTGLQLEKGSTATSFDYRPYGTELALCQRYYLKSYDTNVAPGTASQTNGCLILKVSNNTVPSNEPYGNIIFPVTMRASPTVTTYGFQGGSGKVSNYSGTDLAASSGGVLYNGVNGFSIRNESGGTLTTTLNSVLVHFTSNIEL
jgi:hypothetical protein